MFFFSLTFSSISTLLTSFPSDISSISVSLFISPFSNLFCFFSDSFPRNICHVDYPHLLFYLMLADCIAFPVLRNFIFILEGFFSSLYVLFLVQILVETPLITVVTLFSLFFHLNRGTGYIRWARWSFYIYDKNVFQE